MDWFGEEHDFSYYTFKPTLWQWIKLFFAPVHVTVDMAHETSVIATFQRLNGYVVCTNLSVLSAEKEDET